MKRKQKITMTLAVIATMIMCSCVKDNSNQNNGGGNTYNAHAYVDLELPSGTLWATCNVGANTCDEYGDYFSWGETLPKSIYNWSNYRYCGGDANTLTKYCNNSNSSYFEYFDGMTLLLPEDDAATVNYGANWRTPTKEEWEELCNNTTQIWTSQNGVNGQLFTASNGNSLFLPAAGSRFGNELDSGGIDCDYWSCSLYTDLPSDAWMFSSNSESYHSTNSHRFLGRPVRAVYLPNTSIINASTQMPYHRTSNNLPKEWKWSVSGSGIYQNGSICKVTATAIDGYKFTNWTENDEVVSTDTSYSFTVDGNRHLMANYMYTTVNVVVVTASSSGGSVNGGGSYQIGEKCTVCATANEGYLFSNWTYWTAGEMGGVGSVVSRTPEYSFIVAEQMFGGYNGGTLYLEANFESVYVDLGLPSGTLWATYNTGTFNWNMAQDNLDNDWRLPTKEEWEELWQHTIQNWQHVGCFLTASNGNTLYLPSFEDDDPYSINGENGHFEYSGSYWSSSLNTEDSAWHCYFNYAIDCEFWIENGDCYCSWSENGLNTAHTNSNKFVRPVRSAH